MEKFKDLIKKEEFAYVYGILCADGSLRRIKTKGRVTIELDIRDADIIYKLADILKEYRPKIKQRTRNTNFKDNSNSIRLSLCNTNLVDELIECGLHAGKKSKVCRPPLYEFNEQGFFRGYIDGDGSLGMTAAGIPFIGAVTSSDELYNAFIEFGIKHCGYRKNINRNTRDNVYNIAWSNEDAIIIANYLYKGANVYIDRKYNKFIEMSRWVRTVRKINRYNWPNESDSIILNNSVSCAAKLLNIPYSRIYSRKRSLLNNPKF